MRQLRKANSPDSNGVYHIPGYDPVSRDIGREGDVAYLTNKIRQVVNEAAHLWVSGRKEDAIRMREQLLNDSEVPQVWKEQIQRNFLRMVQQRSVQEPSTQTNDGDSDVFGNGETQMNKKAQTKPMSPEEIKNMQQAMNQAKAGKAVPSNPQFASPPDNEVGVESVSGTPGFTFNQSGVSNVPVGVSNVPSTQTSGTQTQGYKANMSAPRAKPAATPVPGASPPGPVPPVPGIPTAAPAATPAPGASPPVPASPASGTPPAATDPKVKEEAKKEIASGKSADEYLASALKRPHAEYFYPRIMQVYQQLKQKEWVAQNAEDAGMKPEEYHKQFGNGLFPSRMPGGLDGRYDGRYDRRYDRYDRDDGYYDEPDIGMGPGYPGMDARTPWSRPQRPQRERGYGLGNAARNFMSGLNPMNWGRGFRQGWGNAGNDRQDSRDFYNNWDNWRYNRAASSDKLVKTASNEIVLTAYHGSASRIFG